MKVVKNDLFDYGLKIYQDEDNFKFSLDSLLLAEFVNISKNAGKLLDLCSGNAPLPLILASRYHLKITGIELQEPIYNLALKSIKENNFENNIEMLNINALEAPNYFPGNNFDIITCNPPFFKATKTSLINENMSKALARHELTITLKDILNISSKLLKDKGKFYLVHRPDRLEEIITLANEYKFHLKKLEIISSNSQDNAIMVLFEFVKNSSLGGTKINSKIITRETKTYQNIFRK